MDIKFKKSKSFTCQPVHKALLAGVVGSATKSDDGQWKVDYIDGNRASGKWSDGGHFELLRDAKAAIVSTLKAKAREGELLAARAALANG